MSYARQMSAKIKKKFITVDNFCAQKRLKYNTYKGVVGRTQDNLDVAEALLEEGYITKKHPIYLNALKNQKKAS